MLKQLGKQHGFTLIELLVVVLIIGILAAVALPQYQKMVLRSRYATLKSAVNAMANAQKVYFMANGEYADDIDLLVLDFPAPKQKVISGARTVYYYERYYCSLQLTDNLQLLCGLGDPNNSQIAYEFFSLLDGTSNYYCVPHTQDPDDIYHQLCKQERDNGFVFR